MIDRKRRQLITAASAATVAASLPRFTTAACRNSNPQEFAGLELSLTQLNDTAQTVTIANQTQEAVELKHVYPGIVHSNGRVFDINSLLKNHAITVRPGRSVSLSLNVASTPIEERSIPSGLYKSKPISVSTRHPAGGASRSVTTLRSYFV